MASSPTQAPGPKKGSRWWIPFQRSAPQLAGQDLSGQRLAGAWLVGADLKGARLVGTTLSDARLQGADLSEVHAAGADLADAGLERARLCRADLSDCLLDRAVAVEADLSQALLQNASLRGADLGRANLAQASLGSALLVGCCLDKADLTGADLEAIDGRKLRIARARLAGARLQGAQLQQCMGQAADLTGADLSNADLTGADLVGADLSGAVLHGARLDNAGLCGARLQGTDLSGVSARGARIDHYTDPAAREALLRAGAKDLGQGWPLLRGLQARRLEAAQGAPLGRVDLFICRIQQRSGGLGSILAALLAPFAGRLKADPEPARIEQAPPEPQAAAAPPVPAPPLQDPPEDVSIDPHTAPEPQGLGSLDAPAEQEPTPTPRPALAPGPEPEPAAAEPAPAADPASTDPTPPRDSPPIAAPEPPPAGQPRWLLGAIVAVGLGLLLYLAIQYTGPSTVSDENLEDQAVEAVEEGRAIEAARHYGELAERAMDPRERAAWRLEQAAALVLADDPETALHVLAAAGQLDYGDEDLRLRIALREAGLLASLGRHEQALAAYTDITDEPSTSPEYLASALVGVGDAHGRLEQPELGTAALEAALGRYPDNPEVALALGRRLAEAFMARDRGTEGLACLQMLPGASWDPLEHASWLLAQARVLDGLGDFDQALALYDEALQVVGQQGDVALVTRFEVASLRYKRGDLDAARRQLGSLDSDDTPAVLRGHVKLQLAEVLRQLGEADLAELGYRQVLEGWPDDEDLVATAREGLGALMLGAGDEDAVLELLAELELGGDQATAAADVLLGHANGLLGRGEPLAALDVFEQVRAAFEDGSTTAVAADNGRAGALIQLDRNTDALELLRGLRTVSGSQQRLLIDAQIGETLLRSGQLDDAELAFESLLEVARSMGHGEAAAQLGLAAVAEAREQYEEALGLYEQVLAVQDDAEQQVAALQAMANLYLELGRNEESMEAYHRLVAQLPPDSPTLVTIRLSIAELYAQRGDIERERAIWTEVLEDEPTDRHRARALIRLVELEMAVLEGVGDGAAMQAVLGSWRELRADQAIPADLVPDLMFGETVCLVEMGRFEEAIELVDLALEQDLAGPDPSVLLTLKEQAGVALAGGEIDLDALPAGVGGISDDLMEQLLADIQEAIQLRDSGEYDTALTRLSGLLEQIDDRPTQASVLREIALTQAAAGEVGAARGSLDRLLVDYAELDDAVFMASLAMADLDLQEADPRAALDRLEALEPPDDGHAIWRVEALARAHTASGDLDAAQALWQDVLDRWEGDPVISVTAWTGLGDFYMQRGQLDRAVSAFQRAAVLAPEGAQRDQARLRYASASMESGELEVAFEALEELRRDASDAETLVQVSLSLSAVRQEQGDWDQALALVSDLDLQDLGPDYAALVAGAQGTCLVAQGELEQARGTYQSLVQAWPDHAEVSTVVAYGLAEVDAAAGDLPAAAARYEAYIEQTSDRFRQAEALLRLGQLYEASGLNDEASAVFERVVSEYADQPELAAGARQVLD